MLLIVALLPVIPQNHSNSNCILIHDTCVWLLVCGISYKLYDMKNTAEEFREFADKRLNNHIQMLSTEYDRRSISKDVIRQAYNTHQKIYRAELDAKIQSLMPPDNPFMKGELENLKSKYEEKLNLRSYHLS
jgi:hypothetical protein